MTKLLKFHNLGGMGADAGMPELLQGAGYLPSSGTFDADFIVFNGGADIGTSFYNEKPIMQGVPEFASGRDRYEASVYNEFVGKKFMLGICRGAQFLNVLNGGGLWQDVNNHNRDHTILDLDTGHVLRATSTHHQMMRPNFNDGGELIATASESTRKMRDGETVHIDPTKERDLDVEIMWYPKTRSLCIQGHPEYVPGSEFADYCLKLLNKFYYTGKKESVLVI